ncbi:MAG: hypothetical protein ACOYL6_05365 [Bacteriovoracaceae bacterium]
MELKFSAQDFEHFRSWLNFDLDAVTWEGKFVQEFEEFWSTFFYPDIYFKELQSRFRYALRTIKTGTLNSWILWINEKFYCYLFINKNLSLYELSQLTGLSYSYLGVLLRNFFVERFPKYTVDFNEFFQVSDATSPNIHLSFSQIKEKLNLGINTGKKDVEKVGSRSDDLMTSTEVTLYPEWNVFLHALKRDAKTNYVDYGKIQNKKTIKDFFKFLREVVLICSVALALIYGLKYANSYYEKYLTERIGIYEPEFLWLDKNLSYKQENTDTKKIEADLKALEELAQATQSTEMEFKPEERFDTESEVVLTSVDKITDEEDIRPKEPTVYEESGEGYRDTSAGISKVYRVLMKSVSPLEVREKLNRIIAQYGVTQVDKVKPGTIIPGGIYFNLHVPKNKLQEFLKESSLVTETTLYESRIRNPGPPGKVKVFLWIKGL